MQASQCNILIDEHGCAIISDFGLSKVMEGMDKNSSSFAGSTRWMAPELISALVNDEGVSPPISTYSDVYAFGAVCLEVVSERLPFPHRTNDEAVLIDIMRGVRPCRSEMRGVHLTVDDEEVLWRMLEQCWGDTRTNRPTMADLVVFLRTLQCTTMRQ